MLLRPADTHPGAASHAVVVEGLTPADDTLPERYLSEPVQDGPAKGRVVNLAPMLEEYYQARGWDRKTGWPAAERLRDLKLIADAGK